MDTSDIQPYQEYSYLLRACTVAGCSDSSTVGKSFNKLVTAYLLLHHVLAAFRGELEIWKHFSFVYIFGCFQRNSTSHLVL